MRNTVAERVHLDDEGAVQAGLAQRDDPVENRLPVLVAGEIIVGDEEGMHALRHVGADDRLDVVGAAMPGFPALHVDDRAEGALEGAAAPGVETGDRAAGAANDPHGKQRRRRVLDARQVVHVIVERLELAGKGVVQHGVEASLGLAGEQADPERLRLAHVLRHFRQHGEAAGDMKPADGDLGASLAKTPGEIEGARKLVRLHADKADQAGTGLRDGAGDAFRPDARVGLVGSENLDVDVWTQRPPLGAFQRYSVQGGEAVGGDGRTQPLDDIAVVVVVRRFDQMELKRFSGHGTSLRAPARPYCHVRAARGSLVDP